jgi:hypothetical protein
MNTWSSAHLTFETGAKNIHWRKDSLFNKCGWNKVVICLHNTETRSVYKYQLKEDYGP